MSPACTAAWVPSRSAAWARPRRARPRVSGRVGANRPRRRDGRATNGTERGRERFLEVHDEKALAAVEGLGETGRAILEFIYGDLYTRATLSDRDRELAAVVALVSLGRSSQLPQHLRAALKAGLTPDELREVILADGHDRRVPAGDERDLHAEEHPRRARAKTPSRPQRSRDVARPRERDADDHGEHHVAESAAARPASGANRVGSCCASDACAPMNGSHFRQRVQETPTSCSTTSPHPSSAEHRHQLAADRRARPRPRSRRSSRPSPPRRAPRPPPEAELQREALTLR